MKTLVRARAICVGAVVTLAFAGSSLGQEKKADDAGHGIVKPADLKWTAIMQGCELAPVSGNPDAAGEPFVIRLKCIAGTVIPAHWHPTDENVTVLTGTFQVGMGDKYDATRLQTMAPGSFVTVPKEAHHYALSKTLSIVQVHAVGPFKVIWLNPEAVQPPDAKPAAKKAK
jgi:quercetin dioxygenase-like cupin family protein